MKRMLKYCKGNNQKGITFVYLAIALVALIAIAGLAIDVGYMYIAETQLQSAADAAALAGARKLDDTTTVTQIEARRVAWQFGCKNKAAGDPVYLVSNASTDCDTPPTSGLNEVNNVDGDIVVGNWDGTTFDPAKTPINAVKAVARRSAAGSAYGMGPVSIFLGRVLNWNVMNAAASAIAAVVPAKMLPIVVNEYWLWKDVSKRPYANDVHQYPSSFVRQTNIDGTKSKAWGRIFAILGSEANDNLPAGGGSKNMNGYVNLDARTSNHDGSGASWYDLDTGVPTPTPPCPSANCLAAFSGPSTNNTGSISSVRYDASLQYLHEGYPYIMPCAIKEQIRSIDPLTGEYKYPSESTYVIPTSECPFASVAYFSTSGANPIQKKYKDRTFNEVFPAGEKIVAMVYDGSFIADVDPSMPNAVTIVGYVLLQIDGYSDQNPNQLTASPGEGKGKGKDKASEFLKPDGSTAYAHAISDIVEPSGSFGTCDESFMNRVKDLLKQGSKVKLVK